MTGDWLTPAAILALGSPALPASVAALNRHILEAGWRADRQRARRAEGLGGGWEYHLSLLPIEAQATGSALAAEPPGPEPLKPASNPLWAAFERLSQAARKEAQERLAAIDRVTALAGTQPRRLAVGVVAAEVGVSASTLWGWLRLADAVPHADRLAALAPRHRGRVDRAACDPRAWDFLVADYLRGERPCFDACRRRLMEAAGQHGWAPIPSAKTLARRLEREVPRAAQVLARQGEEALRRLYPAQARDRTHLRALEAVNMDGHKLDVFCRFPGQGGEAPRIGRPVLCAIQDLATGLIVGWTLDETENREAVRLAIADMVTDYGIPEAIYLDNGRGFASKWISGRQKSRFRFKIKAEEPEGVLTALGIRVHWTTPFSGQSKPIERAFRDLAEEIARHPACAGAYTGNSPEAKPHTYGQAAVDLAGLEALVAREIERHNQREGRRGNGMAGRSFAAAYADRIAAGDLVRRAGEVQRRLLLLASEAVTVRDTASLHYADNRYWAEELIAWRGRRVVLRFDPRALHEPMAVYAADDGRFVCLAECIEATGFDDVAAARTHARDRAHWIKAQRQALALEQRMSLDQLGRLLPTPAPAAPPAQKVVRLAVGARRDDPWDGAAAFSRAMAQAQGQAREADILPFSPPPED